MKTLWNEHSWHTWTWHWTEPEVKWADIPRWRCTEMRNTGWCTNYWAASLNGRNFQGMGGDLVGNRGGYMHVYVPWKLRLQSACQGASTGTNTHDQLKRTHISMTHCAICKLICNLLRPSRLWRQVCKLRPWYYVLPGCTREPSPLPAIHVDPPITGSVMPHLQLALTWPRQTRQHDLFLINCHGRRSN